MSQFSWFEGKHKHQINYDRRKSIQRSCGQNRSISSYSKNSNYEDTVPELILILHGRLSDLDRYGKLRAELDTYKMFQNLLSVHINSCNTYHIGIKSLIEHNKGNM